MNQHRFSFLIFLILLFSSIKNFSQVLPAIQTESNPHRGIYVDYFFYIDPQEWNNHTPGSTWSQSSLRPEMSMLGTDLNHDGIFEKEDEFLGYCRDNHITYIVLQDLHRVIGQNIMLWNENTGGMEEIELHLCRFMNKAREVYCIDEIAAAAENDGAFQNFKDYSSMFPRRTPPIILSQSQITSSGFNPRLLLMADSTSVIGSPIFLESEQLKLIYRLTHLQGCKECTTYFNYLFLEYEFWHDESDDYVITVVRGKL